MKKNILLVMAILLFVLSALSGWVQTTYYIDSNGGVRDSLFMPLTFIFLFLGVLGLIAWGVGAIFRGVKAKKIEAKQ